MSRYQEIIDGLELSLSLEEDFKILEENFRQQIGKVRGFQRRIFKR